MKRLAIITLLGLGLSLGSAQAATLAGTVINNQGLITGTGADGNPLNVSTEQVQILVTLVPSLLIGPDGDSTSPGQTVTIPSGGQALLTYTVTNTANGDQDVQLSTSHEQNLPARLYLDDGNNTFDAADAEITGNLPMTSGQTVTVFVVTTANSPSTPLVNLSGTTVQGAPVDDINYAQIIVNNTVDLTWSRISPYTQITGTPRSVNINVQLNSDSTTPLSTELKLDVDLPAGITGNYSVLDLNSGMVGNPFPTLQEAFDDYVFNGGRLSSAQELIVEASFAVPDNYPDRTSLKPVFKAWVEPTGGSTVTSPDTQATPETLDYEILIGRGVGTVKKQQNVCVTGAGGFTCGGFSAAPASIKPCDVIFYRISAYNTGLGQLNGVRVTDQLAPGLKLQWAGAQHFDTTELDADGFPTSALSDASVRLSDPAATPWANRESTFADAQGVTLQSSLLAAGAPTTLDPNRGLYTLMMAQVMGVGCAAPQRGVNITGMPDLLTETKR